MAEEKESFQGIRDELDAMKEERRIDQHARITSLEVWRGTVDAEMTAMKESVSQIKEWLKETDQKSDERLRQLEKTIYKAGGAIALGAFILTVVPHVMRFIT